MARRRAGVHFRGGKSLKAIVHKELGLVVPYVQREATKLIAQKLNASTKDFLDAGLTATGSPRRKGVNGRDLDLKNTGAMRQRIGYVVRGNKIIWKPKLPRYMYVNAMKYGAMIRSGEATKTKGFDRLVAETVGEIRTRMKYTGK